MCCLDIFEPQKSRKGLQMFPVLTRYVPDSVERLPTWLVSLSAGPAALHLVLNLTAFTSLPARKIIQTGQSHRLTGTRGSHHSLVSTKPFLPQPLLVQSAPKCNPTLYWFFVFLIQMSHKVVKINSVKAQANLSINMELEISL